MKTKIYLLVLFAILLSNYQTSLAQAVSKVNYQAVLRDANGNANANQTVTIKFEILPANGSAVYEESKTLTTSAFGVINTAFGPLGNADGGSGFGDLDALDWASNGYKLKATVTSPTPAADLGTQSFTVVPYAFHAKTSDTAAYALQSNVSAPILTLNGQTLGIQGSNTVTLPADTDTDEQNLTVSGNTLSLTNSTPASVTLTFTVTGNQVALNGTNVFTIPDLTPSGTIVAYGGNANNIPSGWLLCDGQSYLRTGEYAPLFGVIGTQFGYEDGSHFNVPDLRGMFLRGQNGTRNDAWSDPDRDQRIASGLNGSTGNNVGSAQTDELRDHAHENLIVSLNQVVAVGSTAGAGSVYSQGGTPPPGYSIMSVSGGGNETRPQNVYVNYIIKK